MESPCAKSNKGFDVMRSFSRLQLSTRLSHNKVDSTTPREASKRVLRRNLTSRSGDSLRRRGGIWQSDIPTEIVIDEGNIYESRAQPRRPVIIPDFQNTKANWSPPPSPTRSSPTSPFRSSPPSSPLRSCAYTTSLTPSPTRSTPPSSPLRSYATCTTTPMLLSPPASPVLTMAERNALADRLFAAACSGDTASMTRLIEGGAPINAPTLVQGVFDAFKPAKPGHLSPLAGAASNGQLDAVELLLAHGAILNTTCNQSASSPLHEACRKNDIDIVRQLLGCGADVNINNRYNTTPLMYAAKYGGPELLSLILEHRPDLQKTSFLNTTALHWSIWRGSAEMTQLLIKAGADVNSGSTVGDTPLHWVALTEHHDVARVLLKHGANPLRKNDEGKTALDAAREGGSKPMLKLFYAFMHTPERTDSRLTDRSQR